MIMATREEKLATLARLRQLQSLKASRVNGSALGEPPQEVYGEDPEKMSRFQKFKHGLALSGVETGLGIKGLFTDLSDTDKDVLRMMRSDAKAYGGWSTAGNVAGDVAQMAIPASRLGGLTRAANFGKWGTRAAQLGTDVATAAGFEALQAPKEGQSRLDAAKEGAVAGALGYGLGKGLEKVAKGIGRSDAAKYLEDMGVRLTPGQAADWGLPRAIEYTLGVAPFSAKFVKAAKDRSKTDFNIAMLNRAAPPGKTVSEGGTEGMNQLNRAFKEAYSDAWGKAGRLDDSAVIKLIDDTDAAYDLGREATGPMRKIQEEISKYIDEPTTQRLDILDDKLRVEMQRAQNAQYPNWELVDALDGMRETLLGGINKSARDELAAINAQYGKYKTVESASGSKGGMLGTASNELQGGFFGGDELVSAVQSVGKSGGSRNRPAYGSAPLQTEALAAAQTVGRKEPIPFMNYMRGVAQHVAIPGSGALFFNPMERMVMGRTMPQRLTKNIIDALRRAGITGGTVNTAREE